MAVRNKYRMARTGSSRRTSGLSPNLRLALIIAGGLLACFLVGLLIVMGIRAIAGAFGAEEATASPSSSPSATVAVETTPPVMESAQVTAFELSSTAYNPLEGNLEVSFTISAPTEVYLAVLNTSNEVVAEISNWVVYTAGTHPLQWDGRTAAGETAADGTYKMQLQIGQGGQAMSTGSLPFTVAAVDPLATAEATEEPSASPSPTAAATTAARTAARTASRTATPRPATAKPTTAPTAAPTPTAAPSAAAASVSVKVNMLYNTQYGTAMPITVNVAEAATVTIGIYDENGALVSTVTSASPYAAGAHSVAWSGSTTASPGTYYVKWQATTAAGAATSGTESFYVWSNGTATAAPATTPAATATPGNIIVAPTETADPPAGEETGDGQVIIPE